MYFERLYVCIIRIRRIGYLLFLDVERPTVPVKWVLFYVYFVLVATNLMNRTRNKKFRRSRCEHSQYSSFLGSTVRKLVCHSTSYFQQITIGICERTNNDPSQKRNVSTILFQEKNAFNSLQQYFDRSTTIRISDSDWNRHLNDIQNMFMTSFVVRKPVSRRPLVAVASHTKPFFELMKSSFCARWSQQLFLTAIHCWTQKTASFGESG